jgi:hypothetical protein
MLADPAVYGALADIEAVRICSIAVTKTRAAGAAIVNSQLDLAERTGTLGHEPDGSLSLLGQRLVHGENLTRG